MNLTVGWECTYYLLNAFAFINFVHSVVSSEIFQCSAKQAAISFDRSCCGPVYDWAYEAQLDHPGTDF